MITAADIAQAKKITNYQDKPFHEHDDCIRIAYAWLDAQNKTSSVGRNLRPLKHIIEQWGGRYVSEADVEVAAVLHPNIKGKYPYYNISSRMVLPNFSRLNQVPQANTQPNYRSRLPETKYAFEEAV